MTSQAPIEASSPTERDLLFALLDGLLALSAKIFPGEGMSIAIRGANGEEDRVMWSSYTSWVKLSDLP